MILTHHYRIVRHGRRVFFGLLALLTATLGGCTRNTDNNLPPVQNISDMVAGNGQLTLLAAAITRAGLSTSLTQGGPFTVFAPTDAAFRASGYADVAAVNAIPVGQLQQILQYHVLRASVPSSAITTGQSAQPTSLSATNNLIYVNRTSTNALSVNGARIAQADVVASNGIIHVVDRVLMPPLGSILQVALADTSLSLLVAAAQRGGTAVTTALGGPTPLTIFAPTNSAFRAAGFVDTTAINRAQVSALTGILTNHVVGNVRAYSPTLTNGGTISTFGGGSLTVTIGTSNTLAVTSRGNNGVASRVTTPDINATNGVVHKIDRILLP